MPSLHPMLSHIWRGIGHSIRLVLGTGTSSQVLHCFNAFLTILLCLTIHSPYGTILSICSTLLRPSCASSSLIADSVI